MKAAHVLSSMRMVDGQPYIRGDAYVAELRALAASCREVSAQEWASQPGHRADLHVAWMLEHRADQADAELIAQVSTAARTQPVRHARARPEARPPCERAAELPPATTGRARDVAGS